MFDLTALGELLIDFSPHGLSENGNPVVEQNPGGAPANVAVALARLGRKTAFIGKVGNDNFGLFLRDVLLREKVNAGGLCFSDETHTTLAFVHLNPNGDRSFSFYRQPGADTLLSKDEIDFDQIKASKIFHFGSVSMTGEPSRAATLEAARFAQENGVLVSYDPNLRPSLWSSLDLARKCIFEGLKYADIVKLSEEELSFLTGESDIEKGTDSLFGQYKPKLMVISLGPKGCYYRFKSYSGFLPTYDVRTIDTTGAGDAFLGGLLYKLLETGAALDDLNDSQIRSCVDFANLTGALTTTKKGAIPALPTLDEVLKFQTQIKNT